MSVTPDEREEPPPAPAPRCRLCVAVIGDAESVWAAPAVDDVGGPSFRGVPVLAADGSNVAVVGRSVGDDSRSTRIWHGRPGALVEVARMHERLDPISLVRHRERWHLFGDVDGRAWHGTSDDLVTWTTDEQFTVEHPHLVVRGAASMDHAIVIVGQVVMNGRRMGWTVLEGAEGPYHAREVTFPLTAEHDVVGPVAGPEGELSLVVSSGASHLLARTVAGTKGRSWTLALLTPAVTPSAVFAHEGQIWVAGTDPAGGAPLVAAVGGRAFHLDRSGGEVRAGTVLRDELVLARIPASGHRGAVVEPPEQSPIDAAVDTAVDTAVESGQSSPAYIDSISAA